MVASQAEKDAYKVMRRGTRACRECRRRKIKCIYDDHNDEICQECTAHKRECSKQGTIRRSDSDSNHRSVKVQVTRLETAVMKLARENVSADGIDSPGGASLGGDHVTIEEAELALLDEQLEKRSPIFLLFNNEVLHQKGVLEAYAAEFSNQVKFPDPNVPDREKLLSTIANIPNVYQVLEFASDWWISWREQHFALRNAVGHMSLPDFVQKKLSDNNPTAVALGLMAIAMALGQIRPGLDDLTFNLPVPANHVMNYILAAVDQVVCDADKYQRRGDVLLLFMMRAKHHTENNQLRKAWLRIRQCIRCAQAVGFGSPTSITAALSEEEAEQQRFIAAVFEIDHLISMVLGFPYAKDAAFTDARAFAVLLNPATEDESLKMRALRRIVAVTAGRISDRNASAEISDEFTECTQQTLYVAANAMPPGWWQLLLQPLSGLAAQRYESIMAQLWFWTVQSYLHMPYLINPSNVEPAPRYRSLCMEGARNLIRSFNYLRTEPTIQVYLCNCDDFQALLGACILLVGVLQDASNANPADEHDTSNAMGYASIDSDLALVEDLKDIFRYRMRQQGGGISKQGLAVLDDLTCFLYEDDDINSAVNSVKGDTSGLNINIDKQQKTIMLPYFGTIKVELSKKVPRRRTRDKSQHFMLTPPRSMDDIYSSNSPVQNSGQDYASNSDYGGVNNVLYPNISNFGLVGEPATSYLASDSFIQVPCQQTPVETPYDHNFLDDTLTQPPIAWDQWENYMFDQELNQDWNPGLL